MKRTDYCGALRERDTGRTVTATGWVQTKRDMGGVIFVDLRDREGILQVVFDARNLSPAGFAVADRLKSESVIAVRGDIRIRGEETYNPKLETGTIELAAREIELLSRAETLPFSLEEGERVRESVRMKYRYLDIRRPQLQKNLRFRHRVVRAVEDFLDGAGFLQVETPMLTRSTPEGARDYLVPSRVHPGSFYALPQSPQIFKQLLMVGGVDRYYQIARCFRDEDLRADRQPEFTQVDMELSFVDQEDILQHLERLFKSLFSQVLGVQMEEPFPRLTWRQAMDRYGTDKPDLRFGLPIVELSDLVAGCGFSVFDRAVAAGGLVRGINLPGGASLTRSQIEELTRRALGYGAKGMAWIAIRPNGEINSILTKYFTAAQLDAILQRAGTRPGDLLLFCADSFATVCRTLGGLRLDLAQMLDLRREGDYRFCLVTDFPEFEWSQEEGRYLATHHPFTMPYPEDLPYLQSDPARVRAQAYDVVLNGVELGSGSIRIHQPEVQRQMFAALGFSPAEVEERFGFLVRAFSYGTPPHGGFAFGLDRLVMLMLGAPSLREVIAFPKNKDAICPLTEAPSPVDQGQLAELGLDALLRPDSRGEGARPAPQIDVEAVAELSKLRIAEGERASLAREMEGMIAFADALAQVDTEGVAITSHVVPLENVFRTGGPRPSTGREKLLQNAPEAQDGYLFVPSAVE
ncbi:aspartate--tRNA ligase [bacterium 210820-DFI.6.52]|nr:aspartate--tRNA ligase [bacterium 210820-DFI.6.52]